MDESNKKPNEQLQSIKLGSCKYGLPPGNTSGKGVENVLSASDIELENWLKSNEGASNETYKLCDQEARLAERVKNFSELGTHIFSNYTLFEWSPPERDKPSSYLFLRGVIQIISKYSVYFESDLFKVKEIKDVWLIATNQHLNFSFTRTSKDKAGLFANGNDENCKTGKSICWAD